MIANPWTHRVGLRKALNVVLEGRTLCDMAWDRITRSTTAVAGTRRPRVVVWRPGGVRRHLQATLRVAIDMSP